MVDASTAVNFDSETITVIGIFQKISACDYLCFMEITRSIFKQITRVLTLNESIVLV